LSICARIFTLRGNLSPLISSLTLCGLPFRIRNLIFGLCFFGWRRIESGSFDGRFFDGRSFDGRRSRIGLRCALFGKDLGGFLFMTLSLRRHRAGHTGGSVFSFGFRRLRDLFTFHFGDRRRRLYNMGVYLSRTWTVNPAFEIFTVFCIITQGPKRKEKNQCPAGKRRLAEKSSELASERQNPVALQGVMRLFKEPPGHLITLFGHADQQGHIAQSIYAARDLAGY